jgi:hypothetical protein
MKLMNKKGLEGSGNDMFQAEGQKEIIESLRGLKKWNELCINHVYFHSSSNNRNDLSSLSTRIYHRENGSISFCNA